MNFRRESRVTVVKEKRFCSAKFGNEVKPTVSNSVASFWTEVMKK